MKISITPNALKAFLLSLETPKLTVSSSNIIFNSCAQERLSLKKGNRFILEFEDGFLYIKDSVDNDSFVMNETGKYKLMSSRASNINKLLDNYFKKGYAQFRFEIGEFKSGKRVLTLISGK